MATSEKRRVSSGVTVEVRPKRKREEPNTVRKPEPKNGGFKKATNGFAAKGGKGFGK
jgi:hypothetical protein